MDHLNTFIEQLDFAAQQLHQDNAAYRRFALILTDNVVELMCFDRCQDEFRFDTLFADQGQYSAMQKAKVLDGKFPDLLQFLHSLNLLTADQQTFALQAHDYRNESYHTGIVHDDIMHALAWHYHRVACELFVRLRRKYRILNDVRSPALLKHSGHARLHWGDESNYQLVAASLDAARPLPVPDLPAALSGSICSRILDIQQALNYLVENSPSGTTEEEVVRSIQYHQNLPKGLPPGPLRVSDSEVMRAVEDHIRYMKTEWKPKYPRSPIRRWTARANRLGSTPNPVNALQIFANFRREIEPFAEAVFSAESALSDRIDEQIDLLLERRGGF
jgi:hypothetical protein